MSYNEKDYEEFANRMERKFPLMLGDRYGGFATGAGWWPIIEALCGQIQHHINWTNETRERLLKENPHNHPIPEEVPQVVVEQIKEKLGGLRFYYNGGDSKIDGMVRIAESWAARHCETCGTPGKARSSGWVRTLCDHHEDEYQSQMKVRNENH